MVSKKHYLDFLKDQLAKNETEIKNFGIEIDDD